MQHKIFGSFLVLIFSFFLSCESKSRKKQNERDQIFQDENTSRADYSYQKQNRDNLTIVTWNIQDLGRTKNEAELSEIVKILKSHDIVAIQEVVGKDPGGAQAIAKIVDGLNRTGSKWDYRISDRTQSPSANISERYAFLWKTSQVNLLSKPMLDKLLASKVNREPYIAKFEMKRNRKLFYVINYHSCKYYDHPEKEIVFFNDYPTRLKSDNIFIAGDFNLTEEHEVWSELYTQGFTSALRKSSTTFKKKCKKNNYLSRAIDNVYFSQNINLINSGKIDFVRNCENLKNGRLVSDHLPVFMEFRIY